jgi:uncharacterized protein YkwD
MQRAFTIITVLILVAWIPVGSIAGEKTAFQHTADETKMFELTNQERKAKKIAPLKLNAALSKIARAHSDNMARQGKLAHVLDEKDFDDRVRDAGYRFSALAENVGSGKSATIEMLMKAWMDSEGHRVNILDGDYTEVGIGLARDADGRLYSTQIFAHPKK